MKITLSADYRIRIPKSIIEECGLIGGTLYELEVCDGYLKIPFKNEQQKTKEIIEDARETVRQSDSSTINDAVAVVESKELTNYFDIPTINGIKIMSNLDEGKNFTNKYYSDCGLVIRTKRKYLTKFCDACKGYLADQYGIDTHPCGYKMNLKTNVETLVGTVIQNEMKPSNVVEHAETTITKPNKKVMSIAELFGKSSTTEIKNAVMKSIQENATVLNKDIDDKITAINNLQKVEKQKEEVVIRENKFNQPSITQQATVENGNKDVGIIEKHIKSKVKPR